MLREETKEEEEEKEAMDATTKKTREEEEQQQQQQQQQPLDDDDDDARMIALGGDAKKVAWESDRWPSLTGDEYDAKKFSEKNVEKVLGWREKKETKEVLSLIHI